MIKPRFEIGEWVRAHKTVIFGSNHANNNPERVMFEKPGISGVIVGATTRFLGTIMDSGYDCVKCLNNRKSVMVWQIKQGYMNKTHEALNEDVVSLEDSEIILLKTNIPLRYNHEWHGPRGFESRGRMSVESRDWPRDAQGRFS